MNVHDAGPLLVEIGRWAPVGFGAVAVGGGVGYLVRTRSSFTRRHAANWKGSLEAAGVKSPPRVVGAHPTPAGECYTIQFRDGGHAGEWEAKAERVASALGVRSVQFRPVADNASRARVFVNRRDPLADPVAWPYAEAHETNLLEGVKVGISHGGGEVSLALVWNNMLIGGVPGAGKSNLMSLIVATAALDPNVDLWLIDGKEGVEMACWAKCAKAPVAVDMDSALKILYQVGHATKKRYGELFAHEPPLRKIKLDGTHRIVLLVIDELATFTGDKDFNALLEEIVRMGRAAGVIVVAATQKPAADVVPSRVRDLFTYRCALRCTTPQASDTILGQGWSGLGFDATLVDQANKGEGFLLYETGFPERMRAYVLYDAPLYAIAARAGAIRAYAAKTDAGNSDLAGGKFAPTNGRSVGSIRKLDVDGADDMTDDIDRVGSFEGVAGVSEAEGPPVAEPSWPSLPPRDIEILEAIGSSGSLGRKEIEAKWFGGNSSGASKRLVPMRKMGLLEESRTDPLLGGAAEKVYRLSSRGQEFLAARVEKG